MLKIGDKIEMIRMNDDPDPIPPGTKGVVKHIQDVSMGRDSFSQISVAWENGRSLMVVCPPDAIRRIG